MIFGYAYTSPETAMDALAARGYIKSRAEAVLLTRNSRITKRKSSGEHYFVLSVDDLRKNLPVFNSRAFSTSNVHVFDSALSLSTIDGLAFMDFECLDNAADCLHFNPTPIKSRLWSKLVGTPTAGSQSRKDHIGTLIDVVCRGSLLIPFMTFIYTLGNHQQKSARMVFSKTLRQKKDVRYLIESAKKEGLSSKSISQLKLLYESELAAPYIKAFQAFSKTSDVDALCREQGIAPYEFRYLLLGGE